MFRTPLLLLISFALFAPSAQAVSLSTPTSPDPDLLAAEGAVLRQFFPNIEIVEDGRQRPDRVVTLAGRRDLVPVAGLNELELLSYNFLLLLSSITPPYSDSYVQNLRDSGLMPGPGRLLLNRDGSVLTSYRVVNPQIELLMQPTRPIVHLLDGLSPEQRALYAQPGDFAGSVFYQAFPGADPILVDLLSGYETPVIYGPRPGGYSGFGTFQLSGGGGVPEPSTTLLLLAGLAGLGLAGKRR